MHSLWEAAMSQWAMNVFGELIGEEGRSYCGGESCDVGCIWGFLGALLRGMRDIGPLDLCD